MGRSVAGHADVTQFRAMAGKSSTLPAKLKSELRREFRIIGGRVVTDIQSTIHQMPAGRGPSTGLREDLAANVKVTIAVGAHAGIVIRETMDNQLHPHGLAVAVGKPKGFRHPVFGTDVWVGQTGHAYFAPVIRTHRGETTLAVRRAMESAAAKALR